MAKKKYKFEVVMTATIEVDAFCKDEACDVANNMALRDLLSNLVMEPAKIIEEDAKSTLDSTAE